MFKNRSRLACLMGALALVTTSCGGDGDGEATTDAAADGGGEAVSFRVADQYSLEHSIGRASIQPFMDAVEESSEGQIAFEYFPSDGLVAADDIPEAIGTGTADIGNLVYMGNLNPLLYVPQLPGLFSDDQTVEASEAFWEYVQTNETVQQTFTELGITPLFCFTVPNYQLQFAETGVDAIDELEGKQVRSAGTILPFSVAALGAQPTDIAINEAYDAFNRGVIDSISLSVPSVKAYAFMELIESAIVNADLGGFPVCYGIGTEQFEELSPDLQENLLAEGEKVVTDAAAALEAEVQADLETWEAAGIELNEIDPQARDAALANVEDTWLQELEANGVEGGPEAVEQWKALLDEHLTE